MKGVWTLSIGIAGATTGPTLQALYTSHGTPIVLKPSVSDYTVVLNAPTPSVALIPKINVENYMPATTSIEQQPLFVSNRNDTSFWENLSNVAGGSEAWHNWSSSSSAEMLATTEPMCDFTRVRVSWNGQPRDSDRWVEAEPSALAMMKQINLPEDGSDLVVKIDLERMGGPQNQQGGGSGKMQRRVYSVRYKQQVAGPPGLVGLEATDNNDQKCIVAPTLAEDEQDYYVYADPLAKKVTLNLRCRGSDSELWVNGYKQSGSRDADGFRTVTLDRDLAHHTQLVQVICARPGSQYQPKEQQSQKSHIVERRYAIRIRSDYSLPELDSMPTRIHIPAIHSECLFRHDLLKYYCPDPKLPYHLVQLHTENNPAIKYTLFNQGRSVELRLLNKELSIPFTYTGAYTVRLEAGRFSKDYPLYFDGSLMRTALSILGSILGTLLFILSGALLAIIGAASVYTLGFPIGATEIAGSLAFLIQYLCFSQTLKGSPRLTEFTEPLKWFTLFAPPPFTFINDEDCSLQAPSQNTGGGRVGDLRDYRNAQGALIWGIILMCGFMLIHSGVLFRFQILEKNYTMPHHVKFGGWEKRVLHSLLFPLSVAATYCLSLTDISICPFYRTLAGLILAAYLGWILYEASTIYGMVSSGTVVWIWNSSVREDGRIEDESGYWTDCLADQLLTQPLNRTMTTLRKIFPFSWVSPVADIVPQRINTTGSSSERKRTTGPGSLSPIVTDEEVLRPTQKYRLQKYQPATYGLSKTPQCVEVVRCRKPGGLCRGQRLVAGLLRTTWLDILFTYESLTQLHSNVTGKYYTTTTRAKSLATDGAGGGSVAGGASAPATVQSSPSTAAGGLQRPPTSFVIPLIVKTSQLSGPITGGSEMFFFDGTRVPFIRIADCLYRLIVGVCLGYVLAMYSSTAAGGGGGGTTTTGGFYSNTSPSTYSSSDSQYYGRYGLCFGLIAGLSFLVLCYTATVRPYTRLIEGWLSVASHCTVFVSALSFSIYYLTASPTSSQAENDSSTTVLVADLALWLTVVCCFALGFYSIVIDSSILAAILCPPLDETKFLEALANVSVAISADGRRVETPGYSKFPVQEILLQASQTGRNRVHVSVTPSKQEPCLEFSERDIRHASQNATLALPMATIVTRSARESLGYKYLMITNAQQVANDVSRLADFLTDDEPVDAFPGTVAREITRHIKYQIETRGRNGQTLLTVNIAPPNNTS